MKIFATIAAFAGLASAHMEMSNPPAFRSRHNPHTTNVDYDLVNPLNADGSNYPCKGYHSLWDTPQGASVATWQPGSSQTLSIIGGATHNGGSCQASLSYDRGQTFKVIKSWIGNCPLKQNWQFTVPSDAPSGEAMFAWSWHNNIGNREMYMNCAHVTIGGSNRGSLSGRPDIFVANVNKGCSTVEGSDVLYPNPGPVVENTSSRSAPPVCGRKRALGLRV